MFGEKGRELFSISFGGRRLYLRERGKKKLSSGVIRERSLSSRSGGEKPLLLGKGEVDSGERERRV